LFSGIVHFWFSGAYPSEALSELSVKLGSYPQLEMWSCYWRDWRFGRMRMVEKMMGMFWRIEYSIKSGGIVYLVMEKCGAWY